MCGGGGVVCRRGLRRGAVSRPFRASDLLRALSHDNRTVYVDVDSAGYLVAGGGGAAAGGGGAALCACAALAPSVAASTAVLREAPAPRHEATRLHTSWGLRDTNETLLQVLVAADRAPHSALSVWLDERLRLVLGVPHLTMHNIRGEKEYWCHVCGARFADPNPLKAHLFLSCETPAPHRFWRRVAARLQPAAPPPDPARLEALAADWGRGRGGGGGAHACLYCGKLYSRKYGLKIHIRTHTGYRPLRCRLCARAFGDPSNLNKHVRLHAARAGGAAGSAGLACRVCGKALARRRDLERHLRTHAADDPPPPPQPTPPAPGSPTAAASALATSSVVDIK